MIRLLLDARLIATKDLRIEFRSRILLNQVIPFAFLVLVLFGFALDADQPTLRIFAPGLFWIAILFCALLAVQRSVSIEKDDGADTRLRLSGISPIAVFLGKSASVFVQLIVLEVVLSVGIFVFYGSSVKQPLLMIVTGLLAATAVASTGTLYGELASGLGARESLLPIMLLPVLAPVLIAATRAFEEALGNASVNGWAWLGLLGMFSAAATGFGGLAHGVLVDE